MIDPTQHAQIHIILVCGRGNITPAQEKAVAACRALTKTRIKLWTSGNESESISMARSLMTRRYEPVVLFRDNQAKRTIVEGLLGVGGPLWLLVKTDEAAARFREWLKPEEARGAIRAPAAYQCTECDGLHHHVEQAEDCCRCTKCNTKFGHFLQEERRCGYCEHDTRIAAARRADKRATREAKAASERLKTLLREERPPKGSSPWRVIKEGVVEKPARSSFGVPADIFFGPAKKKRRRS